MNPTPCSSPDRTPHQSRPVWPWLIATILLPLILSGAAPPGSGDRPLLHEAEIVGFELQTTPDGGAHVLISFTRVKPPTDLAYVVKTGTLVSWEAIPTERVEQLTTHDTDDPALEIVTLRLTGPFAGVDQSYFRVLTAAPFAIQNFDEDTPGNADNDTDVISGGIFHDRRMGESTVNLQVLNNSDPAIPIAGPIRLVIEATSDPSVTVLNADGTTAEGKRYFDLTGQMPGPTLDPGEKTAPRPVRFANPKLLQFNIQVSVELLVTVPPGETVATIELPRDSVGRNWIGCTFGAPLTVRATGTEPRTFTLTTRPASLGSRGKLFFGNTGQQPDATVTTSGGPNNIATIRVRGDDEFPSAFQGDLDIVLSEGTQVVDKKRVTMLLVRLSPGRGGTERMPLFNDVPNEYALNTLPVMSRIRFVPLVTRLSAFGSGVESRSPGSVIATPLGPDGLVTGEDGRASFLFTSGGLGPGPMLLQVEAQLNSPGEQSCTAVPAPSGGGPGPELECKAASCDGCNSILPHSGEKMLSVTDLSIPGRGFDWTLSRTYRSQASNYRSFGCDCQDFGVDWCASYIREALIQDGQNIAVFRSCFRADYFMYTGIPGKWEAPIGVFEQLDVNPDGTYELRDASGMVNTYAPFSDDHIGGRLIRIEDRNGNFMTFHYSLIDPDGIPGNGDQKHAMTSIVDTMGRVIEYHYFEGDPLAARNGRLKEVKDFMGRTVSYDYDEEGDLIRCTGPAVTGTPTGNDFPNGKTHRYKYLKLADLPSGLTENQRDRLLHNLTHIWHPNEVGDNLHVDPPDDLARERVTYGMDPIDPTSFDRATSYTVGGTNGSGVPGGGTTTYDYEALLTPTLEPNDPYLRVTIKDRRGNVEVNTYTVWSTLVERRQKAGDQGILEPREFVTKLGYNTDNKPTGVTNALGDSIQSKFNFDRSDRFQNGNRTNVIRLPGTTVSDQIKIETSTVFEPIYNQVARHTDARGFTTTYSFDYQEASQDEVLPLLAAELNTTADVVLQRLQANNIELGRGDLNGDGETTARIGGNVIRVESPEIHRPDGETQTIVTRYLYNQFGQLISTLDPEDNFHTNIYYPEINPGGSSPTPPPGGRPPLDPNTGGYLKQVVRDVAHLEAPAKPNNDSGALATAITTSYIYDKVGNRTTMIDGIGTHFDYTVNQLNQVVQVTRDTRGFAFLERTHYDFNDNVVHTEVEDRDDTWNTSNTGGFVDTLFTYDILDQVLSESREVSTTEHLVTQYRYDANGNRTLLILPEGNAVSYQFDERDLLFEETRGATTATDDTLGPPTGPYNRPSGVGTLPSTLTYNYDDNGNLEETVDAEHHGGATSTSAGVGDVTSYRYDGYNRRVRTIDPLGNVSESHYDPQGNLQSETYFGPVDASGGGNVKLRETIYHYDEINRRDTTDRALFIPTGTDLVRSPTLTEGSLTPDDGKVSQWTIYDRKSRPIKTIQDDEDAFFTAYDGADRRVRTDDPEENVVEYTYDDNGNLLLQTDKDVAQIPGIATEVFETRYQYDALNRPEHVTDNIRQRSFFLYDSRNNLLRTADAQGPLADGSNTQGNVTVFQYDGQSRRVREEKILTASGAGNGTWDPTRDPSQSGGDGSITVQYAFDRNSIMFSLTDDNGFQTQWTYDNLDRKLTETKGVWTKDDLDTEKYRRDDPTTINWSYDRDSNQSSTLDENGSRTDYTFDALNRRTRCDITRASAVEGRPDVVGTTLQTFRYDGLSRFVRGTDNNEPSSTEDDSVITFAYDSLGRVIEETQQIGSLSAKAITSEWHAENQRTALTYPNARRLEYSYDNLDRLNTVRDAGAAAAIADYDYIGASRVLVRAYPQNGTRMTYLDDAGTSAIGYDSLRRPVQLRHLRTDNSLIAGFTHTYDRMNNKLNEAKLHDHANSEVYTYDSAYRLIDFARPNPGGLVPLHSDWRLDGLGNWCQVTSTESGGPVTETRDHSSFNELIRREAGSAVDLGHDNSGNQTDDGKLAFKHDYANRLREAWDNNNTPSDPSDDTLKGAYSYDAVGRRIRKAVTNSGDLDGTTQFCWDSQRIVEERNASDSTLATYAYGNYIDEVLAMERGGATLHYHQNSLWSTIALTEGTGSVVERYSYDAYGSPRITDGTFAPISTNPSGTPHSLVVNPWLFTGRELDEETGHYFYRVRYYDSTAGRFMQRDPLGYADSLNLYSAFAESPANASDPFGTENYKPTGVQGVQQNYVDEVWAPMKPPHVPLTLPPSPGPTYTFPPATPVPTASPRSLVPPWANCVLGCMFNQVRDLVHNVVIAITADAVTGGGIRTAAKKILKETLAKGGKQAAKRVVPAVILAEVCWCVGWCTFDTQSYEPLFR